MTLTSQLDLERARSAAPWKALRKRAWRLRKEELAALRLEIRQGRGSEMQVMKEAVGPLESREPGAGSGE